MTTNDDIDTDPPAPPPATYQPREPRRHSTGVVVGAGLAGALIGAGGTIAAIAFAWIVSVGPPGPPLPPGPPPPPMMGFHHGPPPPPMGGPGVFGFEPPGPPGPPPSPAPPSPALPH
ncbi:hypothetical protein ACKUVQ_12190 [Mycobacterium seoulense]|uniref:hypothetical protein n=1 Tax=Mycobacterium seoulense TaxID=386911 RepID=UPI003CE82A72